MRRLFFLLSATLFLGVLFLAPTISRAATGTIDATYHYSSLLENNSQINWRPTEGTAVVVSDSSITGEIWGENTGWITLNPTEAGVQNDGSGVLSGYAWGENTGWINFKPANGGVTINTTTGAFSGYAWSEVYGWITFDCDHGATSCVKTDWTPSSGGGGSGGGGTSYECSDNGDNDGDGLTDYPDDPGCSSPSDDSEEDGDIIFGGSAECSDGIDNDGNGFIDYPSDPGCSSSSDDSESESLFCDLFPFFCPPPPPVCADGIDNDGDGLIDYPDDPGCSSLTDGSEDNTPVPPPEECVGDACTIEPPSDTCTGDDCGTPPGGEECVGDGCGPTDTETPPQDTTSPGEEAFSHTVDVIASLQSTLAPLGENVLVKVGALLGAIGGLVASLAPIIFGTSLSLGEIFYLPLRLWSLLLSALGLRRKNRPWGVVYDAITKQPLDPAYVVLKDAAGNDVSTSITDLDGRYGFVVAPGTYTIVANKTDYTFPSEKLRGKTEDELYRDLYFGESFTVETEGDLIAKNIPLDPVNFNWNEFVKTRQHLTRFYSKFDTTLVHFSNILFVCGFVLSAIALFVSPTPWNIGVFALYIVLTILRKTKLRPYPFGAVVDEVTGEPVPFAILRFFASTGIEVTHKIADRFGRYYCLIAKGNYTVGIDKKNPDGSYTRVYTSTEPLSVKKGYINATFSL